jgi:hypothetical protein
LKSSICKFFAKGSHTFLCEQTTVPPLRLGLLVSASRTLHGKVSKEKLFAAKVPFAEFLTENIDKFLWVWYIEGKKGRWMT